jgi:ribosomal protein S18 acetylase RimI-like enzyme
MSTTLSVVIRDGLETDVDACLSLDHTYQTDHVWQMNVFEEPGNWQISFKREGLPRTVEAEYPADGDRLRASLPDEHCFLVAADRETGDVVGYLVMRSETPHRIALVQDLVVSRPLRGHGIGSRLLRVARGWAREHDLTEMTCELQTKNYPGITFCQSAGFTFCGFNDHYFQNRDIAVFFSQTIR